MNNLKIGVIGIPGKWSTEVLADTIEQKTGFRQIIDMTHVELDLEKKSVVYNGLNLCDLDAIVVKKINEEYSPSTLDRLEILRVVEASGVRVFSKVLNIIRLIDRLSCTVTLNTADIPMPPTKITETIDQALATIKDYGEAVFKPLYSTKARGMCVIRAEESEDMILAKIREFKQHNPVMYIQKKLELPGKDMGLVFVGGTYHGAYARVAHEGSWNTTIHSGGKYIGIEPSSEVIDIANRAQALFDMDFTTVDVAESEMGPIVFEVSAFGGFRGAKEGLGVDIASEYVKHILKQI